MTTETIIGMCLTFALGVYGTLYVVMLKRASEERVIEVDEVVPVTIIEVPKFLQEQLGETLTIDCSEE